MGCGHHNCGVDVFADQRALPLQFRKMKRQLRSSIIPYALAIVGFVTYACSTVQTGSDPIVVNAEKTLSVTKDTLNLFVTLEHQNQAIIKAKFPAIHSFAQQVRSDAPHLLQAANDAKNQYKYNKGTSPIALSQAIAAVAQLASKAQGYLAQVTTATSP
jgi:hypothetical protein